MIKTDFSSLLNTNSCFFFFFFFFPEDITRRSKRDALNATLYRFIVESFRVFNF